MAVNYVSFLVQNIFRIEQLRTKIKLFIAFVINSSSLVILSLTFKCCFFIVFFRGFKKNENLQDKFFRFLLSINLFWDHVRSHRKFGPDRFSRFDVYWLKTNKQIDKQSIYIDSPLQFEFFF